MIFFWAHRSVLSNLPVIKSLGKHLINDLCLCFVSVFHTVGIYFTLQRKFFFFLEHLTFHNRFQRRYYSSNELIWCYLVANNFLEVLIVRQSVKCRPIFFLFFFYDAFFCLFSSRFHCSCSWKNSFDKICTFCHCISLSCSKWYCLKLITISEWWLK